MILVLGGWCWAGPGLDHDHGVWGDVLERFVAQGRVDYRGLQAEPELLLGYLRGLAEVDSRTFHGWSREEQLAYLMNLYNAQTIDLIRRRYPLNSIRDIGSLLRGPWGQPVVTLFGRIISLDTLLKQVILPNYPDVRVHFGLSPATRGGPKLREEPFRGVDLDEQLDDQVRRFLGDATRNRVDHERRELILSPLFTWHRDEFLRDAGTVNGFVRRFLPEEEVERMGEEVYRVREATYDWRLNDWVR